MTNALFERRHYTKIAEIISASVKHPLKGGAMFTLREREAIAIAFANALTRTNPTFARAAFLDACKAAPD
jgi:hypothetical protein